MKKISLLLVFAMIFSLCLAGCSGKQTEGTTEEETAGTAGGWTIRSGLDSVDVEAAVLELFNKAADGTDSADLTPVAVLGTQVVAGTNYSILCQNSAGELSVVILYADLNGNAEITNAADFDLADYAGSDISLTAEQLDGGWEANAVVPDIALEEDAANAFDNATEEDDAVYNPIAVLGTQVVSGENFAILSLKTEDNNITMCIVTVYLDLEGNAELLSTADIDLASFNQ